MNGRKEIEWETKKRELLRSAFVDAFPTPILSVHRKVFDLYDY